MCLAVSSACLIQTANFLETAQRQRSLKTLLYWDLSGTEEATFSLTLETNGKQLTYVLSMRDDGGYDLQETQSPTHK